MASPHSIPSFEDVLDAFDTNEGLAGFQCIAIINKRRCTKKPSKECKNFTESLLGDEIVDLVSARTLIDHLLCKIHRKEDFWNEVENVWRKDFPEVDFNTPRPRRSSPSPAPDSRPSSKSTTEMLHCYEPQHRSRRSSSCSIASSSVVTFDGSDYEYSSPEEDDDIEIQQDWILEASRGSPSEGKSRKYTQCSSGNICSNCIGHKEMILSPDIQRVQTTSRTSRQYSAPPEITNFDSSGDAGNCSVNAKSNTPTRTVHPAIPKTVRLATSRANASEPSLSVPKDYKQSLRSPSDSMTLTQQTLSRSQNALTNPEAFTRLWLATQTIRRDSSHCHPVSRNAAGVVDLLQRKIFIKEKKDRRKRGYVYILHDLELDLIKIGSATDIDKRIKKLQSDCQIGPDNLAIIYGYRLSPVLAYERLEKLIHRDLAPHRHYFSCGCGYKSSSGSRTSMEHREWYKIERNIAIQTVRTWRNLFLLNPYGNLDREDNSLQWEWVRRLQLAPPVSRDEEHHHHSTRLLRWSNLFDIEDEDADPISPPTYGRRIEPDRDEIESDSSSIEASFRTSDEESVGSCDVPLQSIEEHTSSSMERSEDLPEPISSFIGRLRNLVLG